MSLIIYLVSLLFFGAVMGNIVWSFFTDKNQDYEVWKSAQSDVYLEIFGHKEMTQSTKDRVSEARLSILCLTNNKEE